MSGQCSKPSVRTHVRRRVRPVPRERITRPRRRPRRPRASPARRLRPRPPAAERTSTNPIPGWSRSAGINRGYSSSIRSSVTRPGSRGNEIRPRLPDAITDNSGRPSCRPRAPARYGIQRHRAAGRSAPGRTAQHPRGHGLVADDLGQPGAEVRERLASSAPPAARTRPPHTPRARRPRASPRSAAGTWRPATARGRRARRAGTAAARRRSRPPPERSRDRPAQHRERVGSLDARMVCDLVVGEERRVDDRPAGEHVADDRRDLKVALDDHRLRAHYRVARAAADPRMHVVASLLARCGARARGRRSPARTCGRRRTAARSRRSSRARSAAGGSAPCSSSATSKPHRRTGCSRGSRRRRAADRARPNAAVRSAPASRGWFVTIALPLSFSHHRNAGMSTLDRAGCPPDTRRSATTSRSPSDSSR